MMNNYVQNFDGINDLLNYEKIKSVTIMEMENSKGTYAVCRIRISDLTFYCSLGEDRHAYRTIRMAKEIAKVHGAIFDVKPCCEDLVKKSDQEEKEKFERYEKKMGSSS